jgi:hypothetical protein
MRVLARLAVAGLLVGALTGCKPPLTMPGSTTSIERVGTSTTLNGWKYEFFRNKAYPCSVSGYQTFVIGTKVGSVATASRPLWAFMHGGGAGYFDSAGNPIPSTGQKVEEGAASLRSHLANNGLLAKVRADAARFRTLSVSYCSHDVYAGVNTPDPNNPNTTPEGKPRTTNGLLATKAAIRYTQSVYPTTRVFLHGGSAGSAGTFPVAWSMQLGGVAPAGLVADASVVNHEALAVSFAQGICTEDTDPARLSAIAARVHPDLADPANEPDKVVASGVFTVPIMHIWNHGDSNTCGAAPVECPLRDGTTTTLGITDCIHEPLRRAIDAEGAASRSRNLPLCVDNDATLDCSTHVVTNKVGLVNTDPASPSDYLTAIMGWVHSRLTSP